MRNFADFQKFVAENDNVRRCLVRCDLNLPSDVEDLTRVYAIKDTVLSVLDMGLQVVLISHYKRPKPEDVANPKFSLQNIVKNVADILEVPVHFEKSSVFDMDPTEITERVTLLENLRFYEEETKNDDKLAARLAKFGDVYINDAFSVSHRAHASVSAITQYLPSFAGRSLQREVEGISKATSNIARPYVAIIGGSKVSSKIDVLKQLSQTADYLVVAGAMKNTFLAAQGFDLKASMVEQEQFDTAREILKNSKAEIILPTDFTVSKDINTDGVNCALEDIPDGYECFDIGEATTERVISIIKKCKTLLWNGALGAFEFANFDKSSKAITKAIVEATKGGLVSVIGGGETVASIGEYKKDMTFVSTAGGAFLEFVAGYELPGLTALGA